MRPQNIWGQILAFAACFLGAAAVTFVVALKFVYPMQPGIRQEAMWLMAKEHRHDAGKLREALEAIVDPQHGFGRYERAALLAQIEVIEKGQLSDEGVQRFCTVLMWSRCDKNQVLGALGVVFGKGE